MADKVRVEAGGRVVLPAALCAVMGVREGDTLVASLVDGELRLISRDRAIARVQKRLRELVPGDVSLVDELIAERRREAAREEQDESDSPPASRSG